MTKLFIHLTNNFFFIINNIESVSYDIFLEYFICVSFYTVDECYP